MIVHRKFITFKALAVHRAFEKTLSYTVARMAQSEVRNLSLCAYASALICHGIVRSGLLSIRSIALLQIIQVP